MLAKESRFSLAIFLLVCIYLLHSKNNHKRKNNELRISIDIFTAKLIKITYKTSKFLFNTIPLNYTQSNLSEELMIILLRHIFGHKCYF